MRTAHPLIPLLCIAFLIGPAPAGEDDPKGGPPEFKYLKYRSIGPAAGGRVCRSAGVSGDPLTYYAATAAGGIWKSSDGGFTWKPIFDDQPVSSIGCLAIAPSNPNTIYAGTGEGNIRGNVQAGDGIWKSSDAGKTWKHVWNQVGQIGTMIVHPTNPDIAFAAVLGHAFGPNPERGVYRTTDGGKTWKQVLTKNADTGASDVCFDPTNPSILFAGLWQTRRYPWGLTSGGPGSGLWMSRDGGDTWQQLTHSEEPGEHWGKGLPEGIWGKVGVGVAASDPRRVYALIEAEKGGLYRSDDGGENWKRVNGGHYLSQRAWYYSTLTIDPTNANVIWCPQVRLLKSIDGGVTFKQVKGPHHGDHHDIWIDPRNPRRILDSNDGGVDLTLDGGDSWYWPHLPIAQFYHIAADNRVPYYVSGCMQDIGSASGPSNSLAGNGIQLCDWEDVGGGEAGFIAPDPSDSNIIYGGEYGGYITRYDRRTRQPVSIGSYPIDISGHGATDMRYRFQWTAPILVSTHDPKVVYHGGNVLFRTSDGGKHWTAVSPDLTRNDKSKQQWSGGPITGDNTGAEYYDTIFAVAESPKQKGLLWAGSDDGLVHVTEDDGKNWTNVTKNIPGIPEWGTVNCLEASPFDAGTAYLVVDAHRLDDRRPYLWKTSDRGKTWSSLSAKLPQDVYLHAVREDPKRKGLLYVGTERGVVFSPDDGASWQELKLNLPTVAVHDLVVKDNDLVLGTNGRSVWIFDNLTPLREFSGPVAAEEAHLFPTPPALRWRYHGNYGGKGEGENPPQGALIDYYLKSKPKGEITLEILDARGAVVTTLRSKKQEPEKPASPNRQQIENEEGEDDPDGREGYKKPELKTEPGVHRVAWDLRYEGAEIIKGAKIDAGDPEVGSLVNPGTYTLKLTVGGKSVTTPLVVKLDPRVQLAEADLEEQLKLELAVRDQITQLTRMVNQIHALREQLASRNELLKDNPKTEPLRKEAQALIEKLDALEAKLQNPKAQVTYDILAQRGGAKLYSQLGWLLSQLEDSDAAPTQGERELHAELSQELEKYSGELKALISSDVARLNEEAKKLEVPGVLVPPVGKKDTP